MLPDIGQLRCWAPFPVAGALWHQCPRKEGAPSPLRNSILLPVAKRYSERAEVRALVRTTAWLSTYGAANLDDRASYLPLVSIYLGSVTLAISTKIETAGGRTNIYVFEKSPMSTWLHLPMGGDPDGETLAIALPGLPELLSDHTLGLTALRLELDRLVIK